MQSLIRFHSASCPRRARDVPANTDDSIRDPTLTTALIESRRWLDIGTSSAYRVLAEDRWDEFADTARRDLGDRFETFAEQSRTRFLARFGPELAEAIRVGTPKLVTVTEGNVSPI